MKERKDRLAIENDILRTKLKLIELGWNFNTDCVVYIFSVFISITLFMFFYCCSGYSNSILGQDMEHSQQLQNFHFESLQSFPWKQFAELRHATWFLLILDPRYLVGRLPLRGRLHIVTHGGIDRQLHFTKVRLEVGRNGFSYCMLTLYNTISYGNRRPL